MWRIENIVGGDLRQKRNIDLTPPWAILRSGSSLQYRFFMLWSCVKFIQRNGNIQLVFLGLAKNTAICTEIIAYHCNTCWHLAIFSCLKEITCYYATMFHGIHPILSLFFTKTNCSSNCFTITLRQQPPQGPQGPQGPQPPQGGSGWRCAAIELRWSWGYGSQRTWGTTDF